MVKLSGVSLRITRLIAVASVSCLALVHSAPAFAQSQWYDPRWEALSPSERVIIDRVAAELYADAVRAQSGWSAQNATMRTIDPRYASPQYRALADQQKAPFRAYAINQLTGVVESYGYQNPAPAPYQAPYSQPYQPAPQPAMRNEI